MQIKRLALIGHSSIGISVTYYIAIVLRNLLWLRLQEVNRKAKFYSGHIREAPCDVWLIY